jgi:hypothetical protein
MAQVTATADLLGEASAVADGDLVLSVAAGMAGDASAAGAIEGDFTAGVGLLGEALAGAGLAKVFKLIGASVTGEGDMGGLVSSLTGADVSGTASIVAPTDLVLGAASTPDGVATVVADVDVVLDGGSAVQGEAVVTSSANALYAVSGLAQRIKFSDWSVEFDGATEYATAGDVLGFEYTDDFSISCWIKTTTTATGVLVGKVGDSPTYTGYQFFMSAWGLRFVLVNSDLAADKIQVYTLATLNDGDWHHVAVTWAGNASPDAGDVTFYVDGSESALVVDINALTGTILTSNAFYLGGRASAGQLAPFNGLIDEVAVYDKELSSGEVTWIYNTAVPNDLGDGAAPSDLVAWWRMGDEDTFPTLVDRSISRWSEKAIYLPGDASPPRRASMGPTCLDWQWDTDTRSYSFWFKKNTSSGTMFGKQTDGAGRHGWYVALSSGYLEFHAQYNFIVWSSSRENVGGLGDGDWHHGVIVVPAPHDWTTTLIYVDGVLGTTVGVTSSWPPTPGQLTTNAEPFTLGWHNLGTGPPYGAECRLDELAAYSTVLSGADVTALYNGGVPSDPSLLATWANNIGYWRLGDGDTYPTLLDSGNGTSNDGTMLNLTADNIVGDAPGGNDATMVNMVAGDIVEDTPYVQAGGGSSLTARALEDDEIAGDMAGDAAVVAPSSLNHGAAAAVSGTATIDPNAIVRLAVTPLLIPATVVEPEQRLIGYQPGREPPTVKEKLSLVVDGRDAIERNRSAPRIRTTVRKDTGVSSVSEDEEP